MNTGRKIPRVEGEELVGQQLLPQEQRAELPPLQRVRKEEERQYQWQLQRAAEAKQQQQLLQQEEQYRQKWDPEAERLEKLLEAERLGKRRRDNGGELDTQKKRKGGGKKHKSKQTKLRSKKYKGKRSKKTHRFRR